MAANDREESESQAHGNPSNIKAAQETALPYHTPTLTTFGTLAELVQNNPSGGSDGGVGDCQHN